VVDAPAAPRRPREVPAPVETAGLPALAPNSLLAAIRRGLACRCPRCGSPGLFESFLQPVPHCRVCGQDWRTRSSDDVPPYLVILALGHVVAPGMIALETFFHPPLWVHLVIWLPVVVILGFLLIQPMKGAVMAVQWWHWDRGRDAGGDSSEPAQEDRSGTA